MRAGHLALAKALSKTPMVTKASDVKMLVDCVANAIKLAENVRATQGTQGNKGGAKK